MIVFRLSQPTVLRVTVVRVYPTCKRIGTFTVRGRAGLNRIRFRGRLGRRTLPAGSYRLIVRARGAERDAAAVPIVVARGPVSAATVRRLRRAMACSPAETIAVANPDEADAGSSGGGGGVLAAFRDRIADSVGSAVGGVTRTARGAKARVVETAENPSSTLLTVVGVVALLSAILGGLVLARLVRLYRYRQYYY